MESKPVQINLQIMPSQTLQRAVAKELDNKADGSLKELLDENTRRNDGTGSVGNSGESGTKVQK